MEKTIPFDKGDSFETKLSHFQLTKFKFDRQKSRMLFLGLVVFGVLFIGASIAGRFNILNLVELPNIFNYLGKTMPELRPAYLGYDIGSWFHKAPVWGGDLVDTILMAYLATLLSTVAAFFLAFPASRNLIKNKALYFGTRRFLEFLRGVPELVWALIFVFAFKIGPLPGILAIFVHSTGSLGKMFAEVNENISMEDVEGIRSTGGNWFQIMRFGVVPQVLPNYISYAILRFEINIRASTILGFVGAGGIGHELNLAIRQFHYTDVSAICLMIIGMVILLDFFSEKLRGRIMKGAKLK